MGNKELVKAMARIRNKLNDLEIKKSGGSEFKYFKLEDFLPQIIKFMGEENIVDVFSISSNTFREGEGMAELIITNGEAEGLKYTIPVKTELPEHLKVIKNQTLYAGRVYGYYKKILYMSAFGISDSKEEGEELNPSEEGGKWDNVH